MLLVVSLGGDLQARTRTGAGNMAGKDNVRRIEVEVGGGFIHGNSYGGNPSKIGMALFLEARNNFPGTPFDVSFQGMLGSFSRKNDNLTVNINGGVTVFGDYNWRLGRMAAPFAGVGAGMVFVESRELSTAAVREKTFVFNPRIGVELFGHLRITLEYKWMKAPYSFLGLNVGFAFGGGRKS